MREKCMMSILGVVKARFHVKAGEEYCDMPL